MTDTRTVDPDVDTEAGDGLEDYECCVNGCGQLAVARATLLPCGHQGGYCPTHRKGVVRTFIFHTRTGNLPPCGFCGTTVEAVSWGRM